VTGAVTAPPGLFGRSIYLQDDTGGIRVYLRRGDWPALHLGDRVQAIGRIEDYHGDLQLSVANASALTRLAPGDPLTSTWVKTGQVDEPYEGRLVWVLGHVVKYERYAITLDDGSGPARVYFGEDLPWRRPYVQIGEVWMAVGLVSQYVAARPYIGGYRLLPRFASDFSLPPAFLPTTGGN
jgi:hypothetical protein